MSVISSNFKVNKPRNSIEKVTTLFRQLIECSPGKPTISLLYKVWDTGSWFARATLVINFYFMVLSQSGKRLTHVLLWPVTLRHRHHPWTWLDSLFTSRIKAESFTIVSANNHSPQPCQLKITEVRWRKFSRWDREKAAGFNSSFNTISHSLIHIYLLPMSKN